MELYYTNKDLSPLEGEIWKDVPNYESLYQISNLGRVKSLIKGELILTQIFNIDKYLCVNLYKNGKLKIMKVHRLVGFAFLNNELNKPVINHIDGNKQNNILSNLEWSSIKENNIHAWEMGLKKPSEYQKKRVSECNSGENSKKAKLILNTETGVYYYTIGEAASSINMKRKTLNAMLVGKNRNRTNFVYA
jgi:hypothetical protein